MTTRARFGFFAAPCCCDGPGPSLRPWRVSCRRAPRRRRRRRRPPRTARCSRASAARTPVARRGGPERHLCAIQHLAPRALERVRGDALTRPTRRMWRNPPSEASRPDLSSLEASRLPPATAAARAAIAARAAARTATMVRGAKTFGASRGIRDDCVVVVPRAPREDRHFQGRPRGGTGDDRGGGGTAGGRRAHRAGGGASAVSMREVRRDVRGRELAGVAQGVASQARRHRTRPSRRNIIATAG